MVSYIKTQWFNLVVGLISIGVSIYNFSSGENVWGVAWGLTAVVWWMMSFINYNDDRIKLLEEKAKKYDALCEKVDALYEANKVDRQYIDLLEKYIREIKGIVQDNLK